MRPSTALSADGPINLYNAVLIAGSKEAVGKGVLVCLNDQINAARDVTKTNTSTADTFKSPELGVLGYIQGNRVAFYRLPARRHTLNSEFDISGVDKLPNVEIAYGYANVSRTAVDCLCSERRRRDRLCGSRRRESVGVDGTSAGRRQSKRDSDCSQRQGGKRHSRSKQRSER